MAPSTLKGWFGIVTPDGLLSEVKGNRTLARLTMGGREDRDKCRIVPVQVVVDLDPNPPKRRWLLGRRKR